VGLILEYQLLRPALEQKGLRCEGAVCGLGASTGAGRVATWGAEGQGRGGDPDLSLQVCEPPERRRSGRHWSFSIDERRRLAMLGARERQDADGTPSQSRVRRGPGLRTSLLPRPSRPVLSSALVPPPPCVAPDAAVARRTSRKSWLSWCLRTWTRTCSSPTFRDPPRLPRVPPPSTASWPGARPYGRTRPLRPRPRGHPLPKSLAQPSVCGPAPFLGYFVAGVPFMPSLCPVRGSRSTQRRENRPGPSQGFLRWY
jgi:hypothetical protein